MFLQKIKRLAIIMALAGTTLVCHGGEFQDPLKRPSPVVGSLLNSARLTAIAQAGKRLVAVGPRGLIVTSDDAGMSWKQALTPLSSDLVAVRFPSAKLGWAVGHDGVILHTADGGMTWSKQLDGLGVVAEIKRRYGEDQKALSKDLREEVQRFVDDGADKPFMDVLFLSELEGFAVGAFNLAMRTTDGGKTWQPIFDKTLNPSGYHLYALTLFKGKLYLAGERGLLRRWNKEAQSFDVINSPYEGSYFGILGNGETLFAFGLQGNAFSSRDAGQTWTKLRAMGLASITAAAELADGRLVLGNQGGKVLVSADAGNTFTELSGKRPMPYFGLAPAGAGAVAVVGRNGVNIIAVP